MSRFLAVLLLISSLGCGGDGDLERARQHLDYHRLEAAEALLVDRPGAAAERLRMRLSDLRETRARRLEELDGLAQAEPSDELRRVLREAARSEPDPDVRDAAGRLLSGLADRIAQARHADLAQAIRPRSVPLDDPEPDPEPVALAPGRRRSLPGVAPEDGPEPDQPAAPSQETSPRPGIESSRVARSEVPAEGPSPPRTALAIDPSPAAALELERAGQLAEARATWIELAFAAEPGPLRSDRVARARSLERRLALRAELAAAIAQDPERFAPEGVDGADEQGLEVAGARRDWGALEGALLQRLANRATLSQDARVGLLLERLARGRSADSNAALAELSRALERGELEPAEAFAILADFRGEALPEGGYVFEKGAWITRAEHEAAVLRGRIAELTTRMQRAQGPARDTLVAELLALGSAAREPLRSALEARLAQAVATLAKGNTLGALERLAERRRELDRRRLDALTLIFDEDAYFYPFTGPDIAPGKSASDYWPVQRRVDELVALVQEVWNVPGPVRLPAAFRDALGQLAWVLEVARDLEFVVPTPSSLPSWIGGLPGLDEVDLSTFAWDATERERLAYDRAVLAYNERQWASWSRRDEDRAPRGEERLQVSVTNAYRRMLGRRALAWNPDVQLAARWHSVYMADTGDFGHTQPDPERRTPFDRMRLAGYDQGASENCHMGSGSAEGAHQGWRRSSGHHRNLLMASHREMASALASVYWTQNFGSGTKFLTELDGWHD